MKIRSSKPAGDPRDIAAKATPRFGKKYRELRPKASQPKSQRRWRCQSCERVWRSEIPRGTCPATVRCNGVPQELP